MQYAGVEWVALNCGKRAVILQAQYRGYTIRAGDSNGEVVGFRIHEPGHAAAIVSVDGLASLAVAQLAAVAAADNLPELRQQLTGAA